MDTIEVVIPYVDPTPENEDIIISNTTTNVRFINIARENNKRVALGIIIAIILLIIYVLVFF